MVKIIADNRFGFGNTPFPQTFPILHLYYMIPYIRTIVSRVAFFFALWILPVICLAKRAVEEETERFTPPSWSSYMLAYFLVVLCIGLGLLVVCNPIHRRDKPMNRD